MGADGVPLVLPERFRAHHQLHIGTQVCLIDLDDVVTFLPEGTRDGPVAVNRDVNEGDAEAEILDVGDDLRQVLFGTDHERVLHGSVARQGSQIAMDLALHPFALARPHPAQTQLHPGKVGERVMFGRPAALHGRLVPVAAQKGQTGLLAGHTPQELEQACVVPGN